MPVHDNATRTSGLSLASYAELMRGGKGGAVIVAGHSSESRLVGMIEGRMAPRMPPTGSGLTAAEIVALKAWIDSGAPAGPGQESTRSNPAPADLPAIKPIAPVSGPLSAAAFSPDGRWLAIGGYRRVWLLPVGPSSLIPPPFSLGTVSGPVTSLAFSPNGRVLAAAGGAPGQYGEIQLWDLPTRRLIRTLRGHRDAVYGVAFSPDGRTLAAASYDRMVSLWSVAGGPPRLLKDHIDAVYTVAFSPDGRQVASASGERTIKVWEVATGRRVYTLSEPAAERYAVAFSPNGRQLAAAGADKILRLWNVTPNGGKLARSAFAHEGAVLRVVFSRDSRSLIT